ncbi:type VI secretion system tip protein VgrG [Massilia sp. PAMC28688]|nr:type VI secretion system tip protein VgrG [Massilia sp. PAMC28688]
MRLHSLLGALTQDTRLLQLATPLAMLVPECVRGEEGIDQGFRLTVSALSPDAGIALKSLIGQPALLQLLTAHSRDALRPFHGYITAAEMSGANGGLARYLLTIEPWTRFLEHGRDSRIFQDMTVFDILDTVFASWQGKGKLAPQWRFDIARRDIYPVRSLTTQYQESDMAFASRLMSEEGLFHYFEHAGAPGSPALGQHTMVIADHNGSFQPNVQSSIDFTQSSAVMKRDGLDRWRTELRQQADSVEVLSWDYRRNSARSAAATAGQAGLPAVREALGPYAFETADQGQRLVDNLVQSLGARRKVHVGAGTVRTLAPGTTFALHGHAVHDAAPDDDARTFVVTRVVHLMHNNLSAELRSEVSERLPVSSLEQAIGRDASHSLHAVGTEQGERPLYRVRIDAIHAGVPYRGSVLDDHGALRFPRPTVRGQQTAIVVGALGNSVHTDRDHRIKVQFHWQRGVQSHSRLVHGAPDGHTGAPGDDSAGTWVRVATPMAPVAGANWGSSALPRVGQEVLVDYLEGDIDRPVVIGCLYNGQGQDDAAGNQVAGGAGASTGNAPVWFPGSGGAHAHPASLSGFKSQAMAASQGGSGAYSQLVFDDTAGKARVVLQRHAAAHRGTDELNLGQLRHQCDNEHLAPAGFGAELKSEHSAAVRAGSGLLLSSHGRSGDSAAQLDSREALSQIQASTTLLSDMASTAQKHNAKLKDAEQADEAAPDKLPAIEAMAASGAVVAAIGSGGGKGDAGGAGEAIAYSKPQLQLSSAAGIAASTPAAVVISAGNTSAIVAGQDINCVSQANSHFLTGSGISLFTYGKASSADKPNQETGIRLHAASGKVSTQSQSGAASLTADKAITVASVTKSVTVGAGKHVMLTAQGAFIKLEGGNIMIHGPGKMEFKASKKELTGPKSASQKLTLPPPGKLAQCPAKLDAAGSGGASAI